jgi:hypothetical protein
MLFRGDKDAARFAPEVTMSNHPTALGPTVGGAAIRTGPSSDGLGHPNSGDIGFSVVADKD